MAWPILRIFRPFYQRHKEVLLYLFFGGLTTVISIGSYGLFLLGGMGALVANVFSWIFAVLFAYITNSIWVFESQAGNLSEKCREIVSFYGGRILTLLMEEGILLVFVEGLKGNAMIVKVIAQAAVVIGNYIISKLLVFRKYDR
ncbi:MAG: GtrA family protein [Clostridiales bacterium]|nr:GtrA family protein [Clostridiales bacterium]